MMGSQKRRGNFLREFMEERMLMKLFHTKMPEGHRDEPLTVLDKSKVSLEDGAGQQ